MSITFHIALTARNLADLHQQLAAAIGGPSGLAFLASMTGAQAGGDPEVSFSLESAPSETDPPAAEEPVPAVAEEAPKRRRRARAEAQAEEAPAPAAEPEAPAEIPAKSAAEAAEVVAPAVRIVASWSEGDQTFNLTRAEVLDVARTFISAHPQGKDRGAAVIKGIAASHGYGKLSDVPDELMQDVLDAINEARS